MSDDIVLTLVDSDQTFNFYRGIRLRMSDAGDLVPMNRLERLRARIGDRFRWATRWWYPRCVVTAIDEGTISVGQERWSWRHLKWMPL